MTEACCTALPPVSSACLRCTSCHWWLESTRTSTEPEDFRWPEKLRVRLLSLSEPESFRRCFDRCLRCLRCELCDPLDNSLSLSDVRRPLCLCLHGGMFGFIKFLVCVNLSAYFLHDLESFDDWLSTELERNRCGGMLVPFFRVVADRTDRGLAVTPNKPFCCERAHGALLMLRGESGARLVLLLLL